MISVQCSLILYRSVFRGTRHAGRNQNYAIERLAALEARAVKNAKGISTLFLPIIFLGFSFLLGMNIQLHNHVPAHFYSHHRYDILPKD